MMRPTCARPGTRVRAHAGWSRTATSWTGLEVLGSTGGGLFDTAGTVAFRAHHRTGVVAEDSAFGRSGGRWFYRGPVSDPFTTPPHRRP